MTKLVVEDPPIEIETKVQSNSTEPSGEQNEGNNPLLGVEALLSSVGNEEIMEIDNVK